MPLADTAQICLMVAPPLASGSTQKYGLKRQTAYPGVPGRIVNVKSDRPPRRNKSHSLRQKEAAKFASVSTEAIPPQIPELQAPSEESISLAFRQHRMESSIQTLLHWSPSMLVDGTFE